MIACEQLSWSAGSFALPRLSFSIPSGAYGILMGRSGSGKTTILELLCGLREPSAGRVLLDGMDATGLAPGLRRIGYVPQDSALFPTYSVRENIAFGPRVQGCPRAEVDERVDRVAVQLGISHLLDRLPAGLSGGERQRTALGRALAARPRFLLLDEPLSALDEELRSELCALLLNLHAEYKLTTLHVTHSRREAEELSHLLLTLDSNGVRVHTSGRP